MRNVLKLLGLALVFALPAAAQPADKKDLDGFTCEGGKKGWVRAQAVTPDVVGPCKTGSSGKCAAPGFEYVRGTGWCRPR